LPVSISYAAEGKYRACNDGRTSHFDLRQRDVPRRPAGCAQCRVYRKASRQLPHRKEQPMLDAILLAVGLGFFALSILYAYACDRL